MTQPALPFEGQRTLVAGHRGMVGSAIVRRLQAERCEILCVGRERLDWRRQDETEDWFADQRPDMVVLAAATVGGILANDTHPADFLFDNLAIEINIIHAAYRADVRKLLFLGSSCMYPRLAPQPMCEDDLLTGPFEPTNEWYAVAKIAGLKLCQAYRRQHGCDFITIIPTNLYGPGDNFDLASSHVVPALIRKIHEAKESRAPQVEIWGSGAPKREFLHVDDAADGLVHLLGAYSDAAPVNLGVGRDVSIRELATTICRVAGYDGALVFDSSKPDGMPRKLMNVEKLTALGWAPRIGLEDGLRMTYDWYRGHADQARAVRMERASAVGGKA